VARLEARRQRLDSKLEAEGAEFLVLGLLLIEGIQATKAYTNFPGYDLLAFNPEANTSCRIQVKSRWATDYNKTFPIKSFNCEFVVFVALNRGYRYGRRLRRDDAARRTPEVYVFPVEIVRAAQRPGSTLGTVRLSAIENLDQYRENWALIRAFLRLDEAGR
jgi:hypothetical protein